MSETVLELAQAIRALPRRDVEELREWIEDYLQLEFTDEFAASIERGKKNIAEGNVRIRNPSRRERAEWGRFRFLKLRLRSATR